ncbi:ABC transporter ATP-binding protein [Caulobacter sp. LARHSG274]
MARITLRNVTAAYPVVVSTSQVSAFAHTAKAMSFGRLARGADRTNYVMALQGVSLDIPDGSRVGLIGRNGSGKSTLLKLLSGIIGPMSGTRTVTGTIGCVLNTSAGLDLDKSGQQNMEFVARLYGLHGGELHRTVAEAADFAELGPYIHMPMRTYSSGMAARVAFAIATAQKSDVMLVDEVIGTGDAHFIDKATARVKAICEDSGISVVATHSEGILRNFATHAIWLDGGVIRAQGLVDEVWERYATEAHAA